MSDLLNNIFPNAFELKFLPTNNYHSYKTRNNLSIRAHFFKLDISKNIIFHHGMKIWNNLSPELKLIKNKNKFKKITKYNLINDINS